MGVKSRLSHGTSFISRNQKWNGDWFNNNSFNNERTRFFFFLEAPAIEEKWFIMASAGNQIILNNTFSQNIIFILSVCLPVNSPDTSFCFRPGPRHSLRAHGHTIWRGHVDKRKCIQTLFRLLIPQWSLKPAAGPTLCTSIYIPH